MVSIRKAPSLSRKEVLDAVVAQVPFEGWGQTALTKAAQSLGVSLGFIKMAFPGGAAEMVEAYLAAANESMRDEFLKNFREPMRTQDSIVHAILTRFGLLESHQEVVRRTTAFLLLPPNAALSARCLWRTVDVIWRCVGDLSTDHNYYTKRILLSVIYVSTLLFWLDDTSQDKHETENFLRRRIAGASNIETVRAKFNGLAHSFSDFPRLLAKIRYPEHWS